MSGTESGVSIHSACSCRNIGGLAEVTLGFFAVVLPVEGFHGGAVVVAREVVVGAFDDRKLGRARTVERKLCSWEQGFLDCNNPVRV